MQLTGKTFIVTGAGSGIGRELALQLLRRQAQVAGVDLNAQALQQTQELAEVGADRFQGFVLDITNQEAVANLPGEVASHFGAVDGLINNAGIIQQFKPVKDLSLEEINRVFNVNFFGTLYLTKACLPLLLQRPEAHLTNVSSLGGFAPFPGQTMYGAAKAAVKLFTEGLYSELRDTNVGVTVVFPGAIATNITENSGLGKPSASSSTSKLKPLPASEAAAIILAAIERNQLKVLIGKDAKFLDLLYRVRPAFAINFIQQKMKKLRPLAGS